MRLFWGLRKYAGEQSVVWGGNPKCEHQFELESKETGQQHWNTGGQVIPTPDRVTRDGGQVKQGFCSLCGDWRGQLGLEPTPDCGRPDGRLCSSCYVCHTIEWLRAVRRVLRQDGVVFVDCGDSYFSGNAKPYGTSDKQPQGSLLTLKVAKALGRRGIGIDLSEDYLILAKARIEAVPLPMEGV